MNCVCVTGKSVANAKKYIRNNGGEIATFTLAIEDRYRDASGESTKIVYIDCAAYGKVAAYASHIGKGNDVEVTGQITSYKYTTKSGEIKWKTQIHVSQIAIKAGNMEAPEAIYDSEEFVESEGGEY